MGFTFSTIFSHFFFPFLRGFPVKEPGLLSFQQSSYIFPVRDGDENCDENGKAGQPGAFLVQEEVIDERE